MVEITQNFDWEITKRKLCLFIPNFGKKEQLEFSISQIRTEIPKEDWVVVIGNDGIDIDFSHLRSLNTYYFTLHRTLKECRNGAFIRNYAIKRCQSEKFFQKDPEIILVGDFIKNIIQSPNAWRAGNIYVLNKALSAELLYKHDFGILKYSACIKIDPVKILDPDFVKYIIIAEDGRPGYATYFHYAYSVSTEILYGMRGYDERYLYYGYEDSDMFCRLLYLKQHLIPDYEISAIHLYHDRDSINLDQLKQMRYVFSNQSPSHYPRNKEWGEG